MPWYLPARRHRIVDRLERRTPGFIWRCGGTAFDVGLPTAVAMSGAGLDHGDVLRFVDLRKLTAVAVRSRHVFEFAQKRAAQFTGVEPVQTALFSDDWVAFGIARLYESLMENTLIEARAFRDLAKAAKWLAIPVHVLTLKDEPVPHFGSTAGKRS